MSEYSTNVSTYTSREVTPVVKHNKKTRRYHKRENGLKTQDIIKIIFWFFVCYFGVPILIGVVIFLVFALFFMMFGWLIIIFSFNKISKYVFYFLSTIELYTLLYYFLCIYFIVINLYILFYSLIIVFFFFNKNFNPKFGPQTRSLNLTAIINISVLI